MQWNMVLLSEWNNQRLQSHFLRAIFFRSRDKLFLLVMVFQSVADPTSLIGLCWFLMQCHVGSGLTSINCSFSSSPFTCRDFCQLWEAFDLYWLWTVKSKNSLHSHVEKLCSKTTGHSFKLRGEPIPILGGEGLSTNNYDTHTCCHLWNGPVSCFWVFHSFPSLMLPWSRLVWNMLLV